MIPLFKNAKEIFEYWDVLPNCCANCSHWSWTSGWGEDATGKCVPMSNLTKCTSCCDEHRRMKQPRSKEKVPPMKNKAKEEAITKEKVIRCPWRSVVFHAKRRAPKGYYFGCARNLDANKCCKHGDRVKVRAWVTYVRGVEPCDRGAP